MPAAGHRLAGAGVVVGSTIDPTRIANDHIRIHALEGQLFRSVVEDAAIRNKLRCSIWRERDLYAVATGGREPAGGKASRHARRSGSWSRRPVAGRTEDGGVGRLARAGGKAARVPAKDKCRLKPRSRSGQSSAGVACHPVTLERPTAGAVSREPSTAWPSRGLRAPSLGRFPRDHTEIGRIIALQDRGRRERPISRRVTPMTHADTPRRTRDGRHVGGQSPGPWTRSPVATSGPRRASQPWRRRSSCRCPSQCARPIGTTPRIATAEDRRRARASRGRTARTARCSRSSPTRSPARAGR